eukprot:jgi/Mesvir1/946/Mv17500-RA.1
MGKIDSSTSYLGKRTNALCEGYRCYHQFDNVWKRIKNDYWFNRRLQRRDAVQLKDRWRTLSAALGSSHAATQRSLPAAHAGPAGPPRLTHAAGASGASHAGGHGIQSDAPTHGVIHDDADGGADADGGGLIPLGRAAVTIGAGAAHQGGDTVAVAAAHMHAATPSAEPTFSQPAAAQPSDSCHAHLSADANPTGTTSKTIPPLRGESADRDVGEDGRTGVVVEDSTLGGDLAGEGMTAATLDNAAAAVPIEGGSTSISLAADDIAGPAVVGPPPTQRPPSASPLAPSARRSTPPPVPPPCGDDDDGNKGQMMRDWSAPMPPPRAPRNAKGARGASMAGRPQTRAWARQMAAGGSVRLDGVDVEGSTVAYGSADGPALVIGNDGCRDERAVADKGGVGTVGGCDKGIRGKRGKRGKWGKRDVGHGVTDMPGLGEVEIDISQWPSVEERERAGFGPYHRRTGGPLDHVTYRRRKRSLQQLEGGLDEAADKGGEACSDSEAADGDYAPWMDLKRGGVWPRYGADRCDNDDSLSHTSPMPMVPDPKAPARDGGGGHTDDGGGGISDGGDDDHGGGRDGGDGGVHKDGERGGTSGGGGNDGKDDVQGGGVRDEDEDESVRDGNGPVPDARAAAGGGGGDTWSWLGPPRGLPDRVAPSQLERPATDQLAPETDAGAGGLHVTAEGPRVAKEGAWLMGQRHSVVMGCLPPGLILGMVPAWRRSRPLCHRWLGRTVSRNFTPRGGLLPAHDRGGKTFDVGKNCGGGNVYGSALLDHGTGSTDNHHSRTGIHPGGTGNRHGGTENDFGTSNGHDGTVAVSMGPAVNPPLITPRRKSAAPVAAGLVLPLDRGGLLAAAMARGHHDRTRSSTPSRRQGNEGQSRQRFEAGERTHVTRLLQETVDEFVDDVCDMVGLEFMHLLGLNPDDDA